MPENSPLPFTPADGDQAAGRLAEAVFRDLDQAFRERNLLPILGEARLLLAGYFVWVAIQGQNHLANVIKDGHDITPFIRAQHPRTKEEPPPSPI